MEKNIKTALQALILFIVVLGFGIAGYSCGGHGPASKWGNTTSEKISSQNTHDWGQWKRFMSEYDL